VTIAILVSGLPPDRIGGAEIQAAEVARRLSARHDVVVYTRTATISPELASMPRCSVVRRCRVNTPGVRFAADVLMTLFRLWRARRRVDVILAYQSVIDGFIGVLAKLLFGTPVVVSVRSAMEYRVAEYRQSRIFAPFVFREADRIAVQSPMMAEELVGVFKSHAAGRLAPEGLRQRLCVLANGVEEEVASAATPDAVLFVGRLVAVKGAHFLIDAMRVCPDECLIVVGDGPDRQMLEHAARELANVAFVGMVPPSEVRAYLSRAKMLVVPSLQEGQPNAIMQAMASAVPVIASRVGGVPELVQHGETGFLVEPGDIVSLGAHIRRIGGDPALRLRLGQNAKRAMEPYQWPRVIADVERALAEVVATSGRAHHHP
jgi:glycosyltransferase involved in cell wall biosynthesis